MLGHGLKHAAAHLRRRFFTLKDGGRRGKTTSGSGRPATESQIGYAE